MVPRSTSRRGWITRRRIVVMVVAWLVIGFFRTEMVGRDYFIDTHVGSAVTNIQIEGAIPLIPPFWGISIEGDVPVSPGSSQTYKSTMLLCIEILTGFVIRCGSG